MQKIEVNDKISVYGNINNVDISIENVKTCEIVKHFYELLLKNNLKIAELKNIKISKVVLKNKEIISGKSRFYLRGYAKKKDAEEYSVRNYFNLRGFEIKKIFKELRELYKEYISYFEKNVENLDIVVEKLYIDIVK